MTWWLWVGLGIALAAIELATPGGFFVIFFGVSAIVVGVLGLAGTSMPTWLQWLLFTIIALVALRFFRRPLLARLRSGERPDTVDSMIGEVAVVVSTIESGQYGHAELRGSNWQAHNVGGGPLPAAGRCRVVAVNGLVIDVRSE